MSDHDFEAWVQRARDADILEVARQNGAALKRAGAAEWAGPCPVCGGDDRFSINTKDRVFNCRGAIGGDVIALVEHVTGLDFIGACEAITGEPPPKGEGRPYDEQAEREWRRERADEQRDRAIEREAQDNSELADAIRRSTAYFERLPSAFDTLADEYLDRRRIDLRHWRDADLRFDPACRYRGYASPSDGELSDLGEFPAMIAALKDVHGSITGIHRTYLDLSSPKKLVPPGDRARNAAKKAAGIAGGSLIWLTKPAPYLVTGEGIETTCSAFYLGIGGDGFGYAAAYSLGNMCGGSTGTTPHPSRKQATISNRIPDMASGAMVLPQ